MYLHLRPHKDDKEMIEVYSTKVFDEKVIFYLWGVIPIETFFSQKSKEEIYEALKEGEDIEVELFLREIA